MGSVSLVTRLADSIDHFADRTGHTAAWLALLLVLITFSVVVLR